MLYYQYVGTRNAENSLGQTCHGGDSLAEVRLTEYYSANHVGGFAGFGSRARNRDSCENGRIGASGRDRGTINRR